MKYLLYFLPVLLLISCKKKAEINYSKTDWAYYELKGDVESVSEKSVAASKIPGKPAMNHENPADHNTELRFNENGLLVLEKKWLDNGALFEETKYNGRNQKLLATQYMNGRPFTITENKWDKTGKINVLSERKNPDRSIIEKTEIKITKGLPFERLKFNSQGNLKEKVQYFYDNDRKLFAENLYYNIEFLEQRTEYEYDEKNRKISETKTGKNGELLSKTTYQYEGNNLSTVINYNNANEVDNYEKYEYDSQNNLTSKVFYSAFDKLENKEIIVYGKNNKKVRSESYENGNFISKTIFSYDKSGNIASILGTDANGKTITSKQYKYVYDSHGNWIKKTIKNNTGDKRSYVINRTIKYY